MDLEEMKAGWNVLNERLAQNEILNQRIIKEMITTRTQSAYEKVYSSELAGLITTLIIGFIIFPGNMFLGEFLKWPSFIMGEVLLCSAIAFQVLIVYCLSKFNLEAARLNELSRLILKYKQYRWYGRVWGAILAFAFLIVFLIIENIYTNVYALTTFIVCLSVGLVFSLIQLKKHNARIKSIEQGLAELKEFEE
ncbi:hypothetical protein [Phocaeicola sp.]